MTQLLHHYGGWHPSLPDQRNYVADTGTLPVLPEVDPRKEMPAIFDQGQLGSCTANAASGCFEYDGLLDGKTYNLSRLWIYYQERKIEHQLNQGDTGAYGHDAFKAAKNVGICSERDWPYDITTFETPPAAASKDTGYYKLTKPYAVVPQSDLAIRRVLSNRQTIAFGFTVYESFESEEVSKTGIVPMPGQDEGVLGGHEVLAVGYLKSEPHYYLVRNSWGTGWGLGGYCLFPRAYLLDKDLAGDLRTVQRPAGK